MSLFNKGPSSIDKTPSASGKTIRLNPDAKEFVPFALRSPSATVGPPDASSSFGNFGTTTTLGKAVLDRSESSVSHNSDDEVHDYWRHQLPDDITPDFNNATGDEDSLGINALCLSSLSLADANKASRFTNSFQKESSHHPLSSGFRQSSAEPWDTHGQQLVSDIRDGPSYNGDRGHAYLDVMLNKQHESTEVNPLDFLASQFAGSTAESLADAYFANAGKLNITTERLAQLELQEGGFNWKHNRDPYQDTAIGSSRSSRDLTSSYYDDHGRMKYGDRLANRSSARSAPVWLETGGAVANMYSEMRGEAHDHARLRNAYFEQARQAYLIGHKALAKELSVKGQLHSMQMKAAYDKAQESIYRQRNPVSPAMHRNGRGHERLIDLQGLHVIEAIHVLKRDLTVLRNAARSADQHLQVYIRVGMGHYTRGTRTPARLVAVQRYLLEEEGLDYTEPQPGLLRVQIF